MMGEKALVVRDMSVRFGGVVALNSISLTIPAGTIYGIIGPNGSGKTTLLNAICGFIPFTGQVSLFEQDLKGLPPHKRAKLGLGRTFQNPKVNPDLTVRDLLRVGEYQLGRRVYWKEAFAPWLADSDERQFEAKALGILSELHLQFPSLDVPVHGLPQGVLKMLDLARALMGESRLLLLDESTSGLNQIEIGIVRQLLRQRSGSKLTIVVIEHNVRFLREVCDSATVFDAGQSIAVGEINQVLQLPQVIKAYMGDDGSSSLSVVRHKVRQFDK